MMPRVVGPPFLAPWETLLYREAVSIAVVGASNPFGTLNGIVGMVQTARRAGLDMTAVERHPAIRAAVGHLAYLFGQGLGPTFDDLEKVMAWEREQRAQKASA